jgi:hypothetical protein
MSDFHAIGGVSSSLRTLLLDRMERPDNVASIDVTIGPPPFSATDNNPHLEKPRVNLFLYRVTEHGFLQNQEIPGRGSPGAFGHPPLSLNLHYLVSAYGNTEIRGDTPMFDETIAQFLLGSAMRVLHDVPILTDSLVTVRPPSGVPVLDQSLRDSFERVKLTMEPLTLEDLTKVWTALALRMRLSAGYVVNVIQIESQRKRSFPRPVGQPASPVIPPLPTDAPQPGPMVYVFPIQTPTIADLKVRRVGEIAEQPFPYARVGDTLILRGTSLYGPVTSVAFGDVVEPASHAGPDRVEAVIPDATVPGAGPIPADRLLQPGVRSVRVIVRDPNVPGSNFGSNDAPFMLVPAVNPALLAYAAGPPRSLTLQGTRLIGAVPGGETVIGRASVPCTDYLGAPSPTQIVVPIPDTLPTRGVHVLVGAALPDPVVLGAGAQTLDITIGGTQRPVVANLPPTVARDGLAAIVAALIHDAAPNDPRFAGARVDLWHDKLLVVPGGLTETLAIAASGGSTFAATLGLLAAQPAGGSTALVSGALASPPLLSSPTPRVKLRIGAQAPIDVAVPKATSLATLADALQAAINAGGAVEYLQAQVGVTGTQLLVIPGAAGSVAFDATTADDTSVAELQLHARFAVRVRVNGAESFDLATVELPQ